MHVVKFRESERGWGGEVWHQKFDTKEEAEAAVFKCNKDLPEETPSYYIVATYIGELQELPKNYKI